MSKYFRAFATVAVLALTSVPTLSAETTGTNPPPKRPTTTVPSPSDATIQAVMIYMGW